MISLKKSKSSKGRFWLNIGMQGWHITRRELKTLYRRAGILLEPMRILLK